ncbi:hypothetical protein Pan216_00740 [Planctomycetes bacterium Pan216]|uniref:Uncharacterized protein n=1 Tax=Kolteria novifilia TaxID=2527975 RepID=A0A518AWY7_9BACT|nr:hypothetical protein Pan216_00740 [Planctomycetes bacterium Pan216]
MRRLIVPMLVSSALIAGPPAQVLQAGWFDRIKAGRHKDKQGFLLKEFDDPNTACTLVEVGQALDGIEEGVMDDGVVAVKQPDIWGQARMTRYRLDFENEMKKDLNAFKFILSARVARTDQAAFQQETALGFSLAQKKGTTVMPSPPDPSSPPQRDRQLAALLDLMENATISTVKVDSTIGAPSGSGPDIEDTFFAERDAAYQRSVDMLNRQLAENTIARKEAFGLLKEVFEDIGMQDGKLGVEPTVYLDQKRRYLDHLNEIRRVNLGDDTADSAGYALYLLRMPVSLIPGHRTQRGYGAVLDASIYHQFDPGFLQRTFRRLVINDLLDKISPVVYQAIRSGKVETAIKGRKLIRSEYEDGLEELRKSYRYYPTTVAVKANSAAPAKEAQQGLAILEQLVTPTSEVTFLSPHFRQEIAIARTRLAAGPMLTRTQVNDILGKFAMNSGLSIDVLRDVGWRNIDSRRASPEEILSNINELVDAISPFLENSVARARINQLYGALVSLSGATGLSLSPAPWNESLRSKPFGPSGEKRSPIGLALFERSLLDPIVEASISGSLADSPAFNKLKGMNAKLANNVELKAGELGRLNDEVSKGDNVELKTALQKFGLTEARRSTSSATPSDSDVDASRLATLYREGVEELFLSNSSDKLANAIEQAVRGVRDAISDIQSTASRIQSLGETDAPGTLASGRVVNYSYPIAPSEFQCVFGEENLTKIAIATYQALSTKWPRGTDVRAYLEQELHAAYDLMAGVCPKTNTSALGDVFLIEEVANGALCRDCGELKVLRDRLWSVISACGAENLAGGVCAGDLHRELSEGIIGALCYTIAVDAGLLNRALVEDITRRNGGSVDQCLNEEGGHFFYVPEPGAYLEELFNDYVRVRWPIITFALDPVTNEQNIADAFSLRRDLQLAMAYAFATGRVSFSQLNRFQRRIEFDAETIALNRTVTAYAAGNDTFGWRFTPRYQNPPFERNNLSVFKNLVLGTGPGRGHQLRHSYIEGGQRELTVVAIIPSFLERIRFDTSGNWFRLTQPDDKLVSTKRMLQQGQRVGQLRQALQRACDADCYRPTDIEGISSRIERLEAKLPMQTEYVTVPYENAQGGFDLFQEGNAALVPMLVGYEGIDTINTEKSGAYFLYGKNFSLVESRVVVGGQLIEEDNVDILSREVMAVSFPAGTFKTVLKDDKEYVEVHVATPNGISNRVLLKVSEDSASSTYGYSLPTTEFVGKFGSDGTSWKFDSDGKLDLAATTPLGSAPEPIKVTFEFPDDAKVAPVEVDVASIPSGSPGNTYEVPMADVIKGIVEGHLGPFANVPTTDLPASVEATVKVTPTNGANSTSGTTLTVPQTLTIQLQRGANGTITMDTVSSDYTLLEKEIVACVNVTRNAMTGQLVAWNIKSNVNEVGLARSATGAPDTIDVKIEVPDVCVTEVNAVDKDDQVVVYKVGTKKTLKCMLHAYLGAAPKAPLDLTDLPTSGVEATLYVTPRGGSEVELEDKLTIKFEWGCP